MDRTLLSLKLFVANNKTWTWEKTLSKVWPKVLEWACLTLRVCLQVESHVKWEAGQSIVGGWFKTDEKKGEKKGFLSKIFGGKKDKKERQPIEQDAKIDPAQGGGETRSIRPADSAKVSLLFGSRDDMPS